MNRDESGLLRAILQEGLLTEAQGRRVARAIERGASLEEALGRTPLIDPLDYHKVVRGNAPTDAGPDQAFRAPDRESLQGMNAVAEFDLSEDEGIPLLRRLYDLLGEVLLGGLSGLEIGREGMTSGWTRLFDSRGECLNSRELEPAQAEKMMARLRVMARILPSSRTHERGLLVLNGSGLQAQVLVESQGDGVRVFFYRDAG